jgi:hypothetical protein
VSGLERKKIMTIFTAFINIYERNPTLCEQDYFAILFEAYQSAEENQRIILRDCLLEALLNQHLGRQIMLSLPNEVRSELVLL